ncbi:LuxR C-terminal-related transcriptional regulator [Microbacterium sp. A94]|uniref:LuxR C-terminal-related transcriptional regulator n=1 Tax=Microbacterium sp. A94 TaxID=3450717 RepID=UPI003F42D6A7
MLLIAASAAEREVGLRTPFAMMPRTDLLVLTDPDPTLRDLVERQVEVFDEPGEALRHTKREQVVLNQLAGGISVAEIAETLSVAVETVKNQFGSLYRKLGVSDRASAVATARRRGLL